MYFTDANLWDYMDFRRLKSIFKNIYFTNHSHTEPSTAGSDFPTRSLQNKGQVMLKKIISEDWCMYWRSSKVISYASYSHNSHISLPTYAQRNSGYHYVKYNVKIYILRRVIDIPHIHFTDTLWSFRDTGAFFPPNECSVTRHPLT